MSEDMDAAVTDALGQYQCISTLTAENERLRKRVAELRRALERYGSHDDACSQAKLDAAFAGTKQPACTCGLNAALEDKP